ncbi:MAG TPA: cobyrinate a,c-diamide synthase [Polyangia bacterium]|jgi:cobyrinic acid a,c-diamide synthase
MPSHARVVIAGLSGDSGKTLVSLGLLASWRRAGLSVAAFKKGPDYIDAAWLGWAAGGGARNLDAWLMGDAAVRRSCAWHAREADLTLIEGNRGLFDGLDSSGSASTAALAGLLDAPVILVLPVAKMTATAAALVRGCQALDPGLRLAGVILNRVASARQEQVAIAAIEGACAVPVLGALPRLEDDLLPGRHLGLVTPAEHPRLTAVEARLAEIVDEHMDVPGIAAIARRAPALPVPAAPATAGGHAVRIGYFHDSAFTFYYPENLEALAAAGARLEPISALDDDALPPIDLLYIGGGFPETHAAALSENRSLRAAVRAAAARGLPIYAECGGLMYLAETMRVGGRDYPMSGALPVTVEVTSRPQGHGYCEATIDAPNPFFPVGTALRGHEFHYSRVVAGAAALPTAYAMTRGTGCGNGRDGLVAGNVLASYTHLHAAGVPAWAQSLCRCAARSRRTQA